MPGLLIRLSEWWLSCNLLWGKTVWSKGALLDHVCPQSIGHSRLSALSETYSLPFSKSKVEFPFPPIKELLVYIDVLDLTDELCWKVENELWLQRTPHIFFKPTFQYARRLHYWKYGWPMQFSSFCCLLFPVSLFVLQLKRMWLIPTFIFYLFCSTKWQGLTIFGGI